MSSGVNTDPLMSFIMSRQLWFTALPEWWDLHSPLWWLQLLLPTWLWGSAVWDRLVIVGGTDNIWCISCHCVELYLRQWNQWTILPPRDEPHSMTESVPLPLVTQTECSNATNLLSIVQTTDLWIHSFQHYPPPPFTLVARQQTANITVISMMLHHNDIPC